MATNRNVPAGKTDASKDKSGASLCYQEYERMRQELAGRILELLHAKSGGVNSVLIVEDTEPYISWHKKRLEKLGFCNGSAFTIKNTIQEALDFMRGNVVALVITDMGLPEYPGALPIPTGGTQIIRAASRHQIPVVLSTDRRDVHPNDPPKISKGAYWLSDLRAILHALLGAQNMMPEEAETAVTPTQTQWFASFEKDYDAVDLEK